MNESNDPNERKNAVILPFARPRLPARRGRPKSAHKGSDSGTPELVMKRLLGETTEALDLCLERGIITREQHWCGLHLRWLYTLRHGVPTVRALDPTHIRGSEIKTDDPQWREMREHEYHEAIRKLTKTGHALQILNLCVYNQRPPYLNPKQEFTRQRRVEINNMLMGLREGLDMLDTLWSRKPGKGKK